METKRARKNWLRARRILVSGACLATLIALFYAEEDWRGERAWENCKRELEAKGMVLDWSAYIPPPVPDDQNFFKAPKMAEWFVGRGQNDLSKRLGGNPKTPTIGTTNAIVSEADARAYLQWSDQFAPDFNLIREALKRPAARMDGDYSQPYNVLVPNFIAVRAVAQTLGQRAHCYFLLNQPDRALDELTLMHDLRGVMQPPPSGRPITLVAAMVNVAVAGLYASVIEEGFQKDVWQEPQLVVLQKQTADTDLVPWVFEAFRTEPVANICLFESTPADKVAELIFGTEPSGKAASVWSRLKNPLYLYLEFAPRGWRYQNLVNMVNLAHGRSDSFDTEHALISPRVFEEYSHNLNQLVASKSAFKILVTIAIPNFTKATQTTAHNQTLVNEAQIACALERYRLAHGDYPETLDALVPQFIEKLPHDIIGGEPLHYRRTDDGKFLLYSVGWNETDDGGVPGTLSDPKQGDWVWKN